MLSSCDCDLFNSKNNTYRKNIITVLKESHKILLTQYFPYYITIIFFEPGGFLTESLIINDLIEIALSLKLERKINLTLYIIDNDDRHNNTIKHYIHQKLLSIESNVSISLHFERVKNIKNKLIDNTIDYLLILSIDPYYYLYQKYHKNIIDDISIQRENTPLIIEIMMYAIDNFFYSVGLDILYSNSYLNKNNFIFIQHKGNKTNYSYTSASIYCTKSYSNEELKENGYVFSLNSSIFLKCSSSSIII